MYVEERSQRNPTDSNIFYTLDEDFMNKRPFAFEIEGTRIEVKTWKEMVTKTCEILFKKDPQLFLGLVDDSKFHGTKWKYFSWSLKGMSAPKKVNGTEIYVETKMNANKSINLIKRMIQRFNISAKDCKIYLRTIQTSQPSEDHCAVEIWNDSSDKAKATGLVKVDITPLFAEKLAQVLSAHFANGYRLNSPIELARFRSFAAEDFGGAIMLSDEELKRYISACGTVFDGKVYPVSAEVKERIKDLAEEYFANGAQVIFFAEFFAKNENWLFRASVISEDMLISILRRIFPKLSFTQTYFGYTDASIFAALESEVLRVWGDDVLLTYEQIAERLQYIPLDRIKYALGQNGDFIWNNVETFSHVSQIDITEREREVIRKAAAQECNARGYVSITDLPFGEIEERNYELSVTAVHNAVFRICLSDKYDKNGKIVTRKGDTLDALTIMKDYCRTIEKCSLDDLLNYEKELTGEVHRWIPMEAGNAVLVRIDKETYVADRFVRFDTGAIDAALELCIDGDYLPLKSFTTFGAFPDCGQTWNLFLLESYCRRFSKKFRFDTPSVNSRNAGAVIRKSCGLNYTEIMTDAVANAHVNLTENAIGRFLFDAGYTGRSTTSKVNEIIDKAKAIREMRD